MARTKSLSKRVGGLVLWGGSSDRDLDKLLVGPPPLSRG